MAADDEEPPVQSDSNSEHSYSVMAHNHVLVLHSTGYYDDNSMSMLMCSRQNQYRKPHTVCIKQADALLMVK